MFRISACLLALVLALTAQAQQKKLTPVSFTMNWFPQAEHGGFFAAKAEGIYERHGLDVTIRAGGPQVNVYQLLAAGQTDFILGTAMRVLSAQQQNVPAVAVAASFQKDPITIVSHAGVGHNKLQDLKGQPIRVPITAQNNYWPWLKTRFGFTDDQIRPFEPGYGALASDKKLSMQGFITNDAWNGKKVGLTLHSHLLADYGWANYANTVDATERTIRERPEVVLALVKASAEGWRRYLEDPTRAHAAIRQANPQMDPDLMQFSYTVMKRDGMIDSGDAKGGKLGMMTDARWERFAKDMMAAGVLPASLDWKKAYTLQFVKAL